MKYMKRFTVCCTTAVVVFFSSAANQVLYATKVLKEVRPPASAGVPPILRGRLPIAYIDYTDIWPRVELCRPYSLSFIIFS